MRAWSTPGPLCAGMHIYDSSRALGNASPGCRRLCIAAFFLPCAKHVVLCIASDHLQLKRLLWPDRLVIIIRASAASSEVYSGS